MVQGRKPGEQDQEALELIEKLKTQLGFTNDNQLADKIGVKPQQIARWKKKGITGLTKSLMEMIIENQP